MKIKHILFPMLCLASAAQGAVSLQFSSTSNYLSNFLNGAGSSNGAGARMAWGLVVDAAGDGFDGTALDPYAGGFSLAANANGLALNTLSGGVSDDVLYIASAVMAQNTAATDGSEIGMNRVLTFSGMNFNAGLGVGTGDQYALIWFDVLAVGGTANNGLKYGLFNPPSTNLPGVGPANALPADPGTYVLGPAFAGPDPAKAMEYTLGVAVPEPSAALLGAIGALGLLRRRRN